MIHPFRHSVLKIPFSFCILSRKKEMTRRMMMSLKIEKNPISDDFFYVNDFELTTVMLP